ncbi:HAD-IA family hydrolase [Ornithinimicrobium cryptoxanthini]|uniref:HAD-IA family hydrolase n=1 Tax=Ornithinimicrobium cryptoxanthini TaxID=2934161 RepID=A0ABY4YJ56_9MICO|nr:HAD-IA family hydrolase [Ornithinimicrobium cryptoxanthini]USQ76639.1 HAD-IA family hydrolase [Ornithinimicrobium cryptoxanthini]
MSSAQPPGPAGQPRHRVVLFDFDGTLADTIPLIVASFQHTVSHQFGEVVSEQEARSWIGRTLVDTFAERYPGQAEAMVKTYRDWNLAHHDDLIRAVEGISQVLDGLLVAGCRLGVVSSKSEHTVRRGLQAVGLRHDFDIIVGLEATARHKPHPDPLLHAAEALKVDPAVCAYVGDATVDIRAARAAGMRPVGVTWGAGTTAELRAEGPAAVADTAGELLGILT